MRATTHPSPPCAPPQKRSWVSLTTMTVSPNGSKLTQFVPPHSGSDGWRLYEYITRHFIATVSQDCRYLQTTIDFLISTEAFSCSGKTLISAGVSKDPCARRSDLNGASVAKACFLLGVNQMLLKRQDCSCFCVCFLGRLHGSDALAEHPSGRVPAGL